MLVIAAGYTIFAILTAISPSAGLFLAMRVLLGITIGLSITVVPVFIAESAPASRRGGLATAYQVTCVVGIILGYLVGYSCCLRTRGVGFSVSQPSQHLLCS